MTAHDSDVIGEGANVDLLAEACLIGLGFQGLDLVANALIGSAVLPFGLDGIGSRISGQPTSLRRNFAAVRRLRLAVFCFCDKYSLGGKSGRRNRRNGRMLAVARCAGPSSTAIGSLY